jgi:hypothetical protein
LKRRAPYFPNTPLFKKWHAHHFGENFAPRTHVISARDRCDYTIDRIRSVRTENFRYIRNFLTDRPLLQPQYPESDAGLREVFKQWKKACVNPEYDRIRK